MLQFTKTNNQLLDPHTLDDLNRRYAECYFTIDTGNSKDIALLSYFTVDNNKDLTAHITVFQKDGNSTPLHTKIKDVVIDFSYPELGIINTLTHGAVYVSKKVKRQWLRGLNYNIYIYSYDMEKEILFDTDIAYCILYKNNYTKDCAVNDILKARGTSYGISNNTALVAHYNRSNISVYLDTYEVGHICLLTGDMVLDKPFEVLYEHLSQIYDGKVSVGVY